MKNIQCNYELLCKIDMICVEKVAKNNKHWQLVIFALVLSIYVYMHVIILLFITP